MNAHSSIAVVSLALLGAYYGISLSLGPYPTEQPFPFFSWFLFSAPPTPIRDIESIRILAVNGKTLEEAVLLRNAHAFMNISDGGLIKLEAIVAHLAQSVRNNRSQDTAELRMKLESYFRVPDVEYELAVVTYDLREYLREGKARDVRTLATFRTKEP